MINLDQHHSEANQTKSSVTPEVLTVPNPINPQEQVTIVPPSVQKPKPKSSLPKIMLAVFGLLAFVIIAGSAILISQKQQSDKSPVAPNAPESKPKAFVEKPASCSLTFNVPGPTATPTEGPTVTPTEGPSPTPTEEVTPTPTDGPTPTASPTPTDGPTPTASPTPTEGPSPTPTNGPTATPTPVDQPTATPIVYATATPVPTLPPGVTPNPTTPSQPITYTIVTTVQCNDSCSKNSDCTNPSHICYGADANGNGGRCRLDANPDSSECKLKSGETIAVVRVIPSQKPDMPAELPKSGPEDWGRYLKIGLGALGIGALLLLFL